MSFVTAASIAAAATVVSAGASIYGSNKAADAMQSSSAQSNALSQQLYGQQRADQMPYMQSGYQALNALNRLYGLGQVSTDTTDYGSGAGAGMGFRITDMKYKNKKPIYVDKDGRGFVQAQYGENKGEWIPTGQTYDQWKMPAKTPAPGQPAQGGQVTTEQDRYGGFYASPGYQFRLDEGGRAYDRSAAARGMLLSGAQVKAQNRFGQGMASEEFGNYANALRSIAGVGQVANQNVGNAAGQYGQNASNAMMNSGMARASGYLGTANAIGSVANNVIASIPYWSNNGLGRLPGASATAYDTQGRLVSQRNY
jgi:hypothetical protein